MKRRKSTPEEPRGIGLDRRSFLILGGTGAAAASVSLVPGAPRAIDKLADQSIHRHLPETFLESVCGECSAGCPVLLRRVGEEIVGVRPLESRPCAKAYTIPQQRVHPDRILEPRAVDGGRGGGRWSSLAVDQLAPRLAAILSEGRGRTAVLLQDDGELASHYLGSLIQALDGQVGRFHFVFEDGPIDALEEMSGWRGWEPDLAHATGVLSLGYDLFQRLHPPIRFQEAFRHLRCGEEPLPIIAVGPRLDLTAMKADHWHACAVGSEPLLATWLCRELIEAKSYDRSVEGLEGFAALVQSLADFDAESAARQTGMKPAVVRRLAGDLARRRWLCLGPRRRLEDQRPIVALNALLGRIGGEGGWLPVARVDGPEPWKSLQDGESIPEAVSNGAIDTVVIYGANPAFSSPQPARWRQALAKAKQVVVFASCWNETTALADLVIPLPPAAERSWHHLAVAPEGVSLTATTAAATRPPGVPDPLDLMTSVAGAIGQDGSPLLPATPKDYVEGLQVTAPPSPTIKVGSLSWRAPPWEDGPLHLLLETPLALRRMEGGHLPYLITTVSPHLRRWWETTLEINPQTAERLGLDDNQIVRVTSKAGRIEARLQLFEGVPPDAVCLPLGLGHVQGAFAGRVGGNPAELVSFRREDGVTLWDFTKVEVS